MLDGRARSHGEKGLLDNAEDFGLYAVSGVETLKDITRYAQGKECCELSPLFISLPINRPRRRGIFSSP